MCASAIYVYTQTCRSNKKTLISNKHTNTQTHKYTNKRDKKHIYALVETPLRHTHIWQAAAGGHQQKCSWTLGRAKRDLEMDERVWSE